MFLDPKRTAAKVNANHSLNYRGDGAEMITQGFITCRSIRAQRKIATHAKHDLCWLKPRTADLPTGGLHDAIQEDGIPKIRKNSARLV